MCQTKKNTKTTRESDRREREGGTKTGERREGTLFFFACAIFANTEMSLFLEMFQCPSAKMEDKKKTERKRGLERERERETHDEDSALRKLPLTTAGVCHVDVCKLLFPFRLNEVIDV